MFKHQARVEHRTENTIENLSVPSKRPFFWFIYKFFSNRRKVSFAKKYSKILSEIGSCTTRAQRRFPHTVAYATIHQRYVKKLKEQFSDILTPSDPSWRLSRDRYRLDVCRLRELKNRFLIEMTTQVLASKNKSRDEASKRSPSAAKVSSPWIEPPQANPVIQLARSFFTIAHDLRSVERRPLTPGDSLQIELLCNQLAQAVLK